MKQILKAHESLPEKAETSPTVGDIFRKHGEVFRATHSLHPRQHKVMYDIEHCQCGEFGTHWAVCDSCGHMIKRYNSCRNRHCPGCNHIAQTKWINARIDDLLPVSYHHSVFTLPDLFNPLCLFNRRLMYDLLFEASSRTLLDFGHNPKRLGATIGFYGILHTWGGQLWPHPHVHYIVTAGGINNTGKWVDSKYHATFLFPVKALSTVFRAKFLEGLKKIHPQLKFPDDLKALADPHTFSQWLYHKTPKEWVVFSKPPFSGPEEVVKYIGRYTHRSAICNNRIISDKDGKIEFWFKNTRKGSRWEITSLPVATFIERFLYHVLPKQFHRIRYYGFLANGKAKINIESIRQDMAVESVQALAVPKKAMACPKCEDGIMVTILIMDGYGNVILDNCDSETDRKVPVILDST